MMIRRHFALFLVLLSSLTLFGSTLPVVNFRSYLEKYSKNGDDTEAFKQAFAEVGKHQSRLLTIPPGTYHISDTIDIRGLANGQLRGEGYAEIIMTNPDKDIFYNDCVWNLHIDGLVFRGGRSQIKLCNNNIDCTNITITDCKFFKAARFGIEFEDKMISVHALISGCYFDKCMQAFRTKADWAKIENCWITTNPKMVDKAVIENYGILTVDHVLGVPLRNQEFSRKEAKQRWIDNHGLKLTCKDTRFGGEGGGFSIVYQYTKFSAEYPKIYSSLTIEDCWLYCAGTQVVKFFQVPNKVTINNNTGVLDTVLCNYEPGIDFKELQENSRKIRRIALHFDNNPPCEGTLPEILKPSVVDPEARIKFVPAK